jgi:hypothetical protein
MLLRLTKSPGHASYDHPVDMDPKLELAQKNALAIFEDAAEVDSAEYLSGKYTTRPAWRSFSMPMRKRHHAHGRSGAGRQNALSEISVSSLMRFLMSGFNFGLTNLNGGRF